MPREARCERLAKCSQNDSANTQVKETGCKRVDDGQCNPNEEESGSAEEAGQNASMFHQLLDVF